MVNENYFKVKKLLLYGMIGAVLTMIGDFLLLGVDSNGAIGALGQYILAAEKISYTPHRPGRLLWFCRHSDNRFWFLCSI